MNNNGRPSPTIRGDYPALNFAPYHLRARSRRLQRVTETLTPSSGTTWTAPERCTAIAVSGKGANGSPESGSFGYTDHSTHTTYYSDGKVITTDNGTTTTYWVLSAPADKCTAGSSGTVVATNPPVTYTSQDCHTYTYFDTYHGATTGPSAQISEVTSGATVVALAGGVGGAATISDAGTVAVVPGRTYSVYVPTGGSITITYFK